MKAPEIRNWKRFFRKIYSETPIFTKYILAQQMQKVKEHFVFFRYFYTVFTRQKPKSLLQPPRLIRVHFFRLFRIIYIDFFIPIVYDKIASYGVPIQQAAPKNNKNEHYI